MSFLEDLKRGIPLTRGQVHGRMFMVKRPEDGPVVGQRVSDVAYRMYACVVGTAFVGSPAAPYMIMLDRHTARAPDWQEVWPEMQARAPLCPCGDGKLMIDIGKWDLLALAIHLNDSHGVTRESIGRIIAEQLLYPGRQFFLHSSDIRPVSNRIYPLAYVMADLAEHIKVTHVQEPPAPPAPVAVPEEAEVELVGSGT